MSEETDEGAPSFRIKRGDLEIRYVGKDASEKFERVIVQVISATITPVGPLGPPVGAGQSEVERISLDSGIQAERLHSVLKVTTPSGFEAQIPVLTKRPTMEKDAVLIVGYLLQVGFHAQSIEVAEFKKIMTQGNGFQLPSRTLGLILGGLEQASPPLIQRFGAKKIYKPFILTTDGLEKARTLLKSLAS